MKGLVYIFFQISTRANGGVNSLVEIIDGFSESRPIVITQKETGVNKQLRASGFEVIVAPSSATGSGILPKLRFSYWLYLMLKDRNVQIAHTNDIGALLHSFFFLWLKRIPVLHNVRAINQADRPYGIHWMVLLICNKVVALSKEMEMALRSRLPLPVRVKGGSKFGFIYSIVDFSRFFPLKSSMEVGELREKISLPKEEILVLYVAKFRPVKQQLIYLEHLRREEVNFRTVFVGDFNYKTESYAGACAKVLSEVAEQKYLNVGFVKNVQDFYRAADIVVVPTAREGMARCMIEGLASGLPVVSFDVCSAREILEGHSCGYVEKQGDYQRLFGRLRELASNEQLRKSMGSNGALIARELFSKEKAIIAYDSLYKMIGGEK